MARFAPALLLALTAAWCGTLDGGATFAGSATAIAALLGLLVWQGCSWRDPLRLGRAGRWLPPAVWVAAALSAWASPVPRAGLAGLVLLPAFLGLPDAVARCWPGEAERRQGLRAVAGTVAGIAVWALLDAILENAPKAVMPLGHHNLLAAWLVITLPLAVLPARERGRWRLLGIGSGLLGVAAALASRSLLGGLALAVEAGVAALVLRRRLRGKAVLAGAAVLALALAVGVVLQGPRLARIATGEDSSSRARAVYAAAGWQGFLARPFLGWGPGAAGWTAALFLTPRPGLNPGGEAVGELHSLPLQLAYELGLGGLLPALGLVAVFLRRRLRERKEAADPTLLAAGLLGLAGAAVAALGTASLHVLALPAAGVIAAGACLAARSGNMARESAWPARVYGLASVLVLLPLLAAHRSYDRAVAADLSGDRDQVRQELARAVRLDPGFPLYRMRLALLQENLTQAAEMARRAAEDGHAVAVLWTVAGVLGQAADRPWAPAALQTACSLDPLAPFPPFYRILADPGAEGAARHGAHALLAEPRLAAATFWTRHPDLFAQALVQVRTWPGVDPGWKEALLAAAPAPGKVDGERDRLALEIDADRREALSLFLFHRRPWPAWWPLVPVSRRALERLDLPPATALATTRATAFSASLCTPAVDPEPPPRSAPGRPLPTR